MDDLEDLKVDGRRLSKKDVEALREAGYTTVKYVAYATKRELSEAGLEPKTVEKVWTTAVEKVFSNPFISAAEHHLTQTPEYITTGSRALDKLLGGGVETKRITEVAGQDSSGKTQFCHALAVNVQLPIEKGGLEASVLFYDTEGTFCTRRIVQIAEAQGLDPDEILSRITLASCFTSDQQKALLRDGARQIEEKHVRLIIVDSLISQFRSEYVGRDLLAPRQQIINQYMHTLSRIANAFNLAVVVTNQAISDPTFFGTQKPTGGNIVGHDSVNRVWMRRPKWISTLRIARLTKSPWLPTGECVFQITERGVEDKEDEEKVPWEGIPSEPESNADVELLQEMVTRGYGAYLKSQFGFKFDAEKDGVEGTRIDLFWDRPLAHAVFLDGRPVHETEHQTTIDELVTKALEKQGITVQRFPYNPPFHKQQRIEIADQIESFLKEKKIEVES